MADEQLSFKDKGELTTYLNTNAKDLGLVVRTDADDLSYRESWLKGLITKAVDKNVDRKELHPIVADGIDMVVNRIHSDYDNDIFEATGRKKLPGEKTYKVLK